MKLTDREWGSFYIKDIFSKMQRGKRLTKEKQTVGDKPYISSTSLNNGVDDCIGNESEVRTYKDCLTIANSGSVGETFYHTYEFIASDHVTTLSGDYSERIYKFLASSVKRIGSKYNFNREINDVRLSKEIIMLPITSEGTPDWDFMEAYIREREEEKIEKYKAYAESVLDGLEYGEVERLGEKKWGSFKIGDLFSISTGRLIGSENEKNGNTPIITSTSVNNGIGSFKEVGGLELEIYQDIISVNSHGSVGYSFYHKYPTVFTNNVKILKSLNPINPFISLFLTSQIMAQKEKYSYGYIMSGQRLKRQFVILPIDVVGKPDWKYMEQYVKNEIIKNVKHYKNLKYLTKGV